MQCAASMIKVPHHPLQSTIPPSSKYHTALFKVPYNPLQYTPCPLNGDMQCAASPIKVTFDKDEGSNSSGSRS